MLHSEGTYKLIRRSLIGVLIAIAVITPAVMIFSVHFIPSGDRNGSRAECARRLAALSEALQAHARAHGGRFPDKLPDLFPQYIDNPDPFKCPEDDVDRTISFILLAVQPQAPPDCIIVFEQDSFHGLGINVLLAGGAVEYILESAFHDRLRELLKPPYRECYTDAAINIMQAKAGIPGNPKS